jgi:anti-anti-sigma factor
MKIEQHANTLHVLELRELDSANAAIVLDAVREAMTDMVRHIEVDLSDTAWLDSCGLGTLVAFRKLVAGRGGAVRLRNPSPPALQILELTRLYRVLEVVQRGDVPAGVS